MGSKKIEEEKWYKKLFYKIKNSKSKRHNKLNKNEINRIENAKSDGEPYAKMFDEEYSKMSDNEKREMDDFVEKLAKKIGKDDED